MKWHYNQVRPHQYNDGLTPNESERRFNNEYKSVTNFTWPLHCNNESIVSIIYDYDYLQQARIYWALTENRPIKTIIVISN